MVVEQLTPRMDVRDAPSNHTLGARSALARAGLAGEIWAESIHPRLRGAARPWTSFPRTARAGTGRQRVLLYQAFTGAPDMVSFLASTGEPLAVSYHNITPGALLRTHDPEAAALMDRGREELARLAPRVRLGLACSSFSARELRAWGVRDVRVIPPYAHSPAAEAADPATLKRLRRTRSCVDMLFVGRIVPHKGHLHLLRVLAALRAGWERPVRLFVVGAPGPAPYMAALSAEVARLRLGGAVVFTGSIGDAELAAHYQAADLFLCLSEHEGFCLPVVDAMRAGVPIVANAAGAVPETMGGAGVQLRTLDPLVVAEVVVRVCTSDGLRRTLVDGQRRRAGELDSFDRDGALVTALTEMAADAAGDVGERDRAVTVTG